MANYSVNQVRQMYIANNGYSSGGTLKGQISKVAKTPENELYLLFNGADGVLKSDFIKITNITSAVAVDAAKMAVKMRKVSLTLADNPISGQNYVLGLMFRNFFASGEDSQYYKDAVVHATASMTKSAFYKEMVKTLNRTFSREDGATATTNPYIKFKIGYSTSSESEEGDTNWSSATATKIIIEEKPQEWQLGTKKARRIMFDVFPKEIYTGGDDVIWATQGSDGKYFVEETPTTTVGNGQNIADLEWFCMGERGDQYRNVGWPNVIPTSYLADPDKEYHTIEIHYAFTDSGVNSYRSEKELTIAVPKGASGSEYDAVNAVIGAINTAAGSTLISTLS